MYNIIVKEDGNTNIFYDYNECLLTTWLKDVINTISGNNANLESSDYYKNKTEFKNKIKAGTLRYVLINKYENITINKQINDFSKLGIKNIIVCQNDKSKVMYNIKKFREYLEDNKGEILEYINDENNDKITYFSNNDDNIFYNKNILLTEFIKWCCDKKKSNGYMQ